MRNVIFAGRNQAEAAGGWPHWAVISISEPDAYPANLKDGWHAVLRLEFHDIDRVADSFQPAEPYVLFDRAMARQVIEFVRQCHIEGCEGILVHCKAGISRSAAVAKWIAERHDLPFNHGYVLYNRHVYRLLCAEQEPPE